MKPLFRRLHRWFGLAIALPMMLQGATGAFLVAAPTVDQWHAPKLAAPAAATLAAPLINAAAQATPGLTPVAYQAASGLVPAAVDFAPAASQRATLRLWIDPADEAVLGHEQYPGAFYRLVHGLHESLLLPFGRNLVGTLGICLLLMTLTGAVLWLPPPGRRLAGLALPRKVRGTRLLRELHAVVAVWLLLPLAFQAVSGVSMSFPNQARALFGLPPLHLAQHAAPPRADAGQGHSRPAGKAGPGLATLATQAEAAGNGAALISLRFQGQSGTAMAALRPAPGVSSGMLQLALKGGGVTILNNQRQNAAVLTFMRQLHGAEIGGPVWKLISFIMGISLPLLGITGSLLWLLRWQRRRQQRLHTPPIAATIPSKMETSA